MGEVDDPHPAAAELADDLVIRIARQLRGKLCRRLSIARGGLGHHSRAPGLRRQIGPGEAVVEHGRDDLSVTGKPTEILFR